MAIEQRTYASSEKAKAAMDELFSQGFSDVKTSFKPDRAHVAVNAPFGEGQRVAAILDRHDPLAPDADRADVGGGKPVVARPFELGKVKDSATPLSDFFGWSVLNAYRSPFWPQALVDDPTPLSNRLGWSVLYGAFGETVSRPVSGKATAPAGTAPDKPSSAGTRAAVREAAPPASEAPHPEPAPERKRAKRTGKGADKA